MNQESSKSNKWRVYASIVGLVFIASVLLNIVQIFLNYPTEAHRVVARQIDGFTTQILSGENFATIMDSKEYIEVTSSPEANYINIATYVLLSLNIIFTVTVVGATYHYLRRHRTTTKPVLDTALLVSLGGLLPLMFAAYGAAWYVGTQQPGTSNILIMLFVGVVFGLLINTLIARIFEWYYNRKHSFIVE